MFIYMLQVKSNFQSVCSNIGQFVPTQVNLFQPRSICSNLGQFVSTQVILIFFVFVANKKMFQAPSIFSSSSFFSLSPLYLPHPLFPSCSPNIPAPILFISECLPVSLERQTFDIPLQIRHTYKREYSQQLLNSSFVGYEEFCRSRRVISIEAERRGG